MTDDVVELHKAGLHSTADLVASLGGQVETLRQENERLGDVIAGSFFGEANTTMSENTAIRYVGPFLLWRGHVLTPRPWPRLKLRECLGWRLELGEDVYGVRWIGWSR